MLYFILISSITIRNITQGKQYPVTPKDYDRYKGLYVYLISKIGENICNFFNPLLPRRFR